MVVLVSEVAGVSAQPRQISTETSLALLGGWQALPYKYSFNPVGLQQLCSERRSQYTPIIREYASKRKSSEMTALLAALQDNVLRFHLGMIYRINQHGMVK